MQQPTGMLIGQKGTKYGLQQGARRPSAPGSAPTRAPASVPRPANIFGGDSDSEEDVEAQVARQAEKKRSAAKVQQIYESALAENPSVFEYDGVYESMQQAKEAPRQQEKVVRQSRYIAQLKEKAEQRKREEDLAFERRQLKERQAEDHLYEDKEKFVTSAYRKKLEEDKKWKEQDKLRDEEEAKQDVRKVGHMNNFYANLLTSNVAFGSNAATAAASSRHQDAATDGNTPSTSQPPSTIKPLPSAAPVDKYEALRLEAEHARRQQQEQSGSRFRPSAADADAVDEEEDDNAQEQPAGETGRAGASGRPKSTGEEGLQAGVGDQAATAVAAAAGKRRNDDETVMSARERYLARKKQAIR